MSQHIMSAKNLLRSVYDTYQRKLNLSQTNLAQKDVDNYVTQDANVATLTVKGVTYGAKMDTIKQKVNEDIFKAVRAQNNILSQIKVLDDYKQNANKIFGDKDKQDALAHLATDMMNQLKSFAVSPNDINCAQEAMSAINAVVKNMRTMTQSLQQERINADDDLVQSVTNVNMILSKIGNVNASIAAKAYTDDGSIFPYLNERRELLHQLSAYIKIDEDYFNPLDYTHTKIIDMDGNTLVDNNLVSTLSIDQTFTFHTNTKGNPIIFNDISGFVKQLDLTAETHSGALYEFSNMRDTILPKMQQELDGYAAVLRDAFNELHNQGIAMRPPSQMIGVNKVPNADLTGSLELQSDMVLSGVGSLRLGVVDVKTGLLENVASISLTDNMTLGSFMDMINQAGIPMTASITSDGRLQLETSDLGKGIVLGNDGNIDARISASSSFNTNQNFGVSHFFGLNNLLQSDGFSLGDGVNGLCETLSMRPDVLSSSLLFAKGKFSDQKDVGEIVLNIGDVTMLEEMSNLLDKTYEFKQNSLVPRSTTTLSGYCIAVATRNFRESQIYSDKLKQETYVLSGLSVKSQEMHGVNEQFELALSLDLVKSTSFVTRMMSFQYEIEDAVLNIK